MKKGFIFLIVFLLIAAICGSVFFLPKLISTNDKTNSSETANNTTTNNSTTPEQKEPTNNKPQVFPETPIIVPDEMQAVIDENRDMIYKDTTQALAAAFPVQMIPLYNASSVSDSYGITNDKGKPGWNTTYVSQGTVDELLAFYTSLMSTATNFTQTPSNLATNLKGTISGYSVSITISPNNPDKTGVQGASSVNIFIEEL